MADWATHALLKARAQTEADWDFLILDLGDCPETFRLYGFENTSVFDAGKFENLIASRSAFGFDDFARSFGDGVASPPDLYSCKRRELADHNVRDLEDAVLAWNTRPGFDFNGGDGYLMWLAFGSLALLEPLRAPNFCRHILQGRRKIHLLSGFEEIFFHLATVTPQGLQFPE
jgi:hypothetical protein